MKKEDLEVYGKVEHFEITDQSLIIKITDGFNPNAINTFNLMKKINKGFPQFPFIKRAVTDNNIFDVEYIA